MITYDAPAISGVVGSSWNLMMPLPMLTPHLTPQVGRDAPTREDGPGFEISAVMDGSLGINSYTVNYSHIIYVTIMYGQKIHQLI